MPNIDIEVQNDSRKININRTSMKIDYTIVFCLDQIIPEIADYEFRSASDDVQALKYAYTLFPVLRYLPTYYLDKKVLVLSDLSLEQISAKTWKAVAKYSFDINNGTGNESAPNNSDSLPYVRVNFSIGGGTRHINQSLETTSHVLATNAIIPGKSVSPEIIGLTEDSIQGADIPDATLRLQITGYFLPSAITFAYVQTLRALVAGVRNTGTYNNAVYMQQAIGEVQLRAISGGGTVVDIIPLTFDFLLKVNQTNTIDPGFPNLTMKGHDLLDYRYYQQHDNVAKKILMSPQERLVQRVHSPANYALLGLPV